MCIYSTLAELVAKEEKKETQTCKHKMNKCPALRTGMVLRYDHFAMATSVASSMRFLLLLWLHYYSYPYKSWW